MRSPARLDLELPLPVDRPLVGETTAVEGPRSGLSQDSSRDEEIILQLRDKLKDRNQGNVSVTGGRRAGDRRPAGEEDKYEPQRLNRKICWQYDSSARKVPLLRRPYI